MKIKYSDVNILVKKKKKKKKTKATTTTRTDYDAKITDIENKNITTADYNNSTKIFMIVA